VVIEGHGPEQIRDRNTKLARDGPERHVRQVAVPLVKRVQQREERGGFSTPRDEEILVRENGSHPNPPGGNVLVGQAARPAGTPASTLPGSDAGGNDDNLGGVKYGNEEWGSEEGAE
jgi:hypothetical protein